MKKYYLGIIALLVFSCGKQNYAENDFEGGHYRFEVGSRGDALSDLPVGVEIAREENSIMVKMSGACHQQDFVFLSNSRAIIGTDSIYLHIAVEQNYEGSSDESTVSKCVCCNKHLFTFDEPLDSELPVSIKFSKP